ncbi:ROK family protein [uncultured Sphingomonas sp.]|uniref:ROK family protein n=1 Tax=uncultured Sphingomonas sp. TaxID=158754 RepID=UPI0025DB2E46|nr:ROK family protein [uncultured Sphingomonas sp.]
MAKIGIDFGGTKIEAAALDDAGAWLSRLRTPTPGNYDAAIRAVADLIAQTEQAVGPVASVGIGAPGSISTRTGVMRNANTTYLNGRRFREDLVTALGREVRLENDANCLALSEAFDGAAAGARVTFAVIIGTGCGGGLVVDGRIVDGANGIAGEWGHIPLPWASGDEVPGPVCWCGLNGCLEKWISGTGFQDDYQRRTGVAKKGADIIAEARAGDPASAATLDTYIDRLGRALAVIANIADPDCFVFGGGMSNVSEIYARLPAVIDRYTFSDAWEARLVPAQWGDSSGVRGAAHLWS